MKTFVWISAQTKLNSILRTQGQAHLLLLERRSPSVSQARSTPRETVVVLVARRQEEGRGMAPPPKGCRCWRKTTEVGGATRQQRRKADAARRNDRWSEKTGGVSIIVSRTIRLQGPRSYARATEIRRGGRAVGGASGGRRAAEKDRGWSVPMLCRDVAVVEVHTGGGEPGLHSVLHGVVCHSRRGRQRSGATTTCGLTVQITGLARGLSRRRDQSR